MNASEVLHVRTLAVLDNRSRSVEKISCNMLRSAVSKSFRSCTHFLKLRICSICSTASKDAADFYDITIVGGGMVGASLACALGEFAARRGEGARDTTHVHLPFLGQIVII